MRSWPAYGRPGGLNQTAQRISTAERPRATHPAAERLPHRRDNETGVREQGVVCVEAPWRFAFGA
jgi:hypothetical protein